MKTSVHEVVDDILIVKVGSSTLTNEDGTKLDYESFDRIGSQLTRFHKLGKKVVLISSASIAAGMVATGTKQRPSREDDMVELQRLSSRGWIPLLNAWSRSLPGAGIAPILLTRHELDPGMKERNEVLNTLYRMLVRGDFPIANENDPIAHEEIEYGDNDKLAATLAARMIGKPSLYGANINLVLLSDVHGVYSDPKDPSTRIPEIYNLADYADLAGPSTNPLGSGGMTAKFEAADIAMAAGVDMWIVHGREDNSIQSALDGISGTHFVPKPNMAAGIN